MDLFEVFNSKRVVVSGHTGFKGSWLTFMLKNMGAEVYGFSIDTPDNLKHAFYALDIQNNVSTSSIHNGNVADEGFITFLTRVKPDFIFHLAAQSILKVSYQEPLNTLKVNTLGTLNLLEYLRLESRSVASVIVTSDKCYQNLGKTYAYSEEDNLSGTDPYSASKACCELMYRAYLESFFKLQKKGVATARAGNVFGGGDWSKHRLIPDCVSQVLSRGRMELRMPAATRPWTYVLDVLHGYLKLAAKLSHSPSVYSSSWNFASGEVLTVQEVAESVRSYFSQFLGFIEVTSDASLFPEHSFLQIDASKAKQQLDWECKKSVENSLLSTVEWYWRQHLGHNLQEFSKEEVTRTLLQ